VRRDFDAPLAGSLAGAHGLARVREGERAFRCIDCHGGASFVGRARVKALAAKDSLVYLTGHFEEPEGMRWPLWDEDCTKCHDAFDTSAYEAWESPRFHQLPVHNADLGVACVECHEVHQTQGSPENHFLRAERVRTQCARCHAEFEQLAQR
jgi:predicted CXXCH cytochrome family protein